jgi:hypothetical protein
MTDFAGVLIRGVRRMVTPAGLTEESMKPVAATVAAPNIPGQALAVLCARIQSSLAASQSALGLRRGVTTKPAGQRGDDTIWVLIDGRPAAVVDAEVERTAEPDWGTTVANKIDAAMQSRFRLLLGDSERVQYAEAIRRFTEDDRKDVYLPIPAYLLDNGVSLNRIETATLRTDQRLETAREPTPAAVAEVVLDAIADSKIVLELPRSTLRRARGSDVERIKQVRVEVYAETGVQFPDLRLHVLDDSAAPIRLKANDIWLETGTAADADWSQVAEGIKAAVLSRAAWFIRCSDIATQRDRLADALGALVELSRATYSDAVVTACLRALVRSGESVRNLQRVLWLLHDTVDAPDSDAHRFASLAADVPADPRHGAESLAARVRARMADEAWRTSAPVPPGQCVALSAEDGESLLNGSSASRADLECRIIAALCGATNVRLVAAPRAGVVAPLRYALGAMENSPAVVSLQELSLDTKVTQLKL